MFFRKKLTGDPATRLRVLMAERNVNVNELAAMSGVSRHTISALRNGSKRYPRIDTAYLLAEALGVNVSKIWDNL